MVSQIEPGDVLLVALPLQQPSGREQVGRRPAIVVGVPPGQVRYPVILIAPLTTQTGEWVQRNLLIYPQLSVGIAGLNQPSVVLLDQVRAVDVKRIVGYLGSLTTKQYQPIVEGLQQIFRL